MKNILIVVFLLFATALPSFCDELKFDVPIKKLYLKPDINSETVFNIPIDVKLLGSTEDKTWYKVKIAFNFLGYHEYVGWMQVK